MKGRKPKPGKVLPAYMRVIGDQEAPDEEKASAAAGGGPLATERVRFEAPEWFDDRDRAIFDFLQDHGFRLDMLDAIDQVELQMLAREFADWQRCQEEINAWRADPKNKGSVTYASRGRNGTQYKTIPQVHQASQHLRNIAALGSNFGLSPVDRERLKFLRVPPGEREQGNLLD